jgi:hypothetical protein
MSSVGLFRRIIQSPHVSTLCLPYRAITKIGSRHPFAFGTIVACAKTGTADFIVQKYVERAEKIDQRRLALFSFWGFFWLGSVQYFIYVKLFAQILFPNVRGFVSKTIREKIADKQGQLIVLKQVALDQLIHHPFFFFPAFYSLKSFVESESACSLSGYVREGLTNYRCNIRTDLTFCWATWVPAFLINFSICPLWMRVPFVAGVLFFFTMYWSFLHGEPIVKDPQKETE